MLILWLQAYIFITLSLKRVSVDVQHAGLFIISVHNVSQNRCLFPRLFTKHTFRSWIDCFIDTITHGSHFLILNFIEIIFQFLLFHSEFINKLFIILLFVVNIHLFFCHAEIWGQLLIDILISLTFTPGSLPCFRIRS